MVFMLNGVLLLFEVFLESVMSQAQSSAIKDQNNLQPSDKKVSEWKRFLLMGFIVLPIFTLLIICAYGFVVWFGQELFWGPPGP